MSPLESILRFVIKAFSSLYFHLIYSPKQKSRKYHAVSGKVLGNEELSNMIDASLDMWLTTGRFNDQFEEKLAKFIGARFALTTNSGSSANLLAITALTSPKLQQRALQAGDEVITVAAGFPTTVNPIIQNNLVPVFVDVELGTNNINANQIESAITSKTKAIFVAHTLGNVYELDKIQAICKKHNLWLVEDNCDALGSKYLGQNTGTFGDISTMSFYPAHHITMGEGGALITNDPLLRKIIMSFRDWGRDCWCPGGRDNTCNNRFGFSLGALPEGYDHKYIYSHIGYNLKITDWQAACGLAQLDKLESFIQARKSNFDILSAGLKDLEEYLILPHAVENAEPSWFGFPITVKATAPFNKIELARYLEENNIGTRQLFAGNILRQPAYLDRSFKLRIRDSELLDSKDLTDKHYAMLPNSDIVMKQTFWIGVWPGLRRDELDYMIKVIHEFCGKSYFT